MGEVNITIESILDGWQEVEYFGGKEQYLDGIGIDPDMPKNDSSAKPSGLIRPTAMAKFSGANVNAVPMFITTNPKNNKIYVILNNGKFISYDNNLATETLINTLANASGNGQEYYDNAIYIATDTDIARYYRLDGTPAIVASYWVGTLGKTALGNKTYPSINGVPMPNHVMYRMNKDNKLYILDVGADNKGYLHYIKTKKTTNEGDTDDGSTYQGLDFGYGLYPTSITHGGDNLVIALIEGTDIDINQKPAKLAVWDKSSTSFDNITLDGFFDPLITAVRNVLGEVWVFSGFATGGCRVSKYLGGDTLQEIVYLSDIYPPVSQGAIAHIIDRIVFATNTITPEASASVFAIGGKSTRGLHNILRAVATGANLYATALKYVQQSNGKIMQPIVGYKSDTEKGIDKISTTYGDYNIVRTGKIRIGKKFKIQEVSFPVLPAIAANMTLIVKVITSDGADTKTLATINNTNYSGKNLIEIKGIKGIFENDLDLQFEWTGSALVTVSLPINITLDVL